MNQEETDMIEIEVELDEDQLEYIKENNIDLSALIREKIKKLRDSSKEKQPSIIYDKNHDILYINFYSLPAEAEFIMDGCYVRKEIDTDNVVGLHIEDFFNKTNDEDFRKGMLEKLME